ncbi:MAG: triose-phosphate isomerase [Chloroflexota bacterium]
MRIPFVAGNWKMNTTLEEAVALTREMRERLDAVGGVEKVLCPPFISLAAVKEVLRGSAVKLGAQNAYFEEKGAFTGEISPVMLKGLCEFVIIGHSERRQYFGESNDVVNKKLKVALKVGVRPIFCVGERLEENEGGRTEEVVAGQLALGLEGIPPSAGMVIAYEPVWAIGTGKAATSGQAEATIALIRKKLAGLWDQEAAGQMRILYGGSVTGANIAQFAAEADIDGALVGGASLKAADFVYIVEGVAAAKRGR